MAIMEKINGGHYKVLAKTSSASSIVQVASRLLLSFCPKRELMEMKYGRQNDAITK